MTPREVETVYEALAIQIDAIGPEKREMFLAKLALLMAHEIGDAPRVCRMIEDAAKNIDV